jgi:hypothetical protein
MIKKENRYVDEIEFMRNGHYCQGKRNRLEQERNLHVWHKP